MNIAPVQIEKSQIQKLLSAASGDSALLYLYIQSGNDPAEAQKALRLSSARYECAAATLRQLGLWPEEKKKILQTGDRPQYTEKDVLQAMDTDRSFRSLYGEIQRLLGRTLNTEELKIILSFDRYLGLPPEVITVLVSYCRDRARQKGSVRNPSLRTIEKEAYNWAEQGIDSMEEAAAYIHAQNVRRSQLHGMMDLLQIRGRELTAAEERYGVAWLQMGFDKGALQYAYERTCLNTGGMNWAYMNKILTRWNEAGLHKLKDIRQGDQKAVPKGASGQLGQAELDAIQKVLKGD